MSNRRFKIACRMLRQAGHFDRPLPGQRPGESPIDWLVRLRLAPDAHRAAEMLILGADLSGLLEELLELPEGLGEPPQQP